MMRMRTRVHKPWLAAALAAAGACGQPAPAPQTVTPPASQALAPPLPFEDEGACPFEGCTYREWTAREAIAVRRERDEAAPVAFRVAARETVSAVTGVVVTTAPGEFRVREAYEMFTRDGGLPMKPGDVVHLLTYEGEGTYTVWFDGAVRRGADVSGLLSGACRPPGACPGEVVSSPETEWWVQVRNAAGESGWTNQPDLFDGKDRLQ